MTDEERIEHLGRQLDDALLRVFDLENKQKSDSMIRYELEEMLKSIYHECLRLKDSGKKPDTDALLKNLSENIKRLFQDFKLNL